MADVDPPYRFDPLQNPTNVKWGEGLKLRFVWVLESSGSGLPWPADPQPDIPAQTCSIQSSPRNDFSGLPGGDAVTKILDDGAITFSVLFGQTQFNWDATPPSFKPTSAGLLVLKYTSTWWIPTDGVGPITGDPNCEGTNPGIPPGSWHAGQAQYLSVGVFN